MSSKSKFFYKVDKDNHPVPGNLIKANKKPIGSNWRQVPTDACCDDLCPTPGPGDTLELNLFSNGVQTPIPILTATNSFSISGGIATMNDNATATIITFEVPDSYGESAFDIFSGNNSQLNLMDYTTNGTTFTITAVVGLYGGGDMGVLFKNIIVDTPLTDDIYVSIGFRAANLNNTLSGVRYVVSELSAQPIKIEFPNAPSVNYDILIYNNGVLVHSLLNNATQIVSFNSNTIPGFQFDKIEIVAS